MQNNLFDIDRRLNKKFHLLIFFGILISVLLFLPIQTVSSQSSGHIYYVSPSGNDGSVGSLSQPWKTIGKAASVAISGDVVYIRGGVYYEWIEFSRSGTSTLPSPLLIILGKSRLLMVITTLFLVLSMDHY